MERRNTHQKKEKKHEKRGKKTAAGQVEQDGEVRDLGSDLLPGGTSDPAANYRRLAQSKQGKKSKRKPKKKQKKRSPKLGKKKSGYDALIAVFKPTIEKKNPKKNKKKKQTEPPSR